MLLLVGGVAKLLASILTYPHELVRTRMREGLETQHKYSNLLTTFKKEEGVNSLYKGMGAYI
jgi:solute carrier family 25 protein 33/36